jgi:hypothetical protein
MNDFFKDPVVLFSLLSAALFGLAVLGLCLRLVRKLGVHILEVLLLVLLTAAGAFLVGGWYFHRVRVRAYEKEFTRLQERATDPDRWKAEWNESLDRLKRKKWWSRD